MCPIIIYLFFATGVYNFSTLPIVSEKVIKTESFKNLNDETVQLKNKLTVLGFLGDDLTDRKINVYNLHEEIYKGIHSSDEDFQMLMLLPFGTELQVEEVIVELSRYADIDKWEFAFGTPEAIERVFASLQTTLPLDANYGTNYVFIVDKEGRQRCASDKEFKAINGYDATSVSILHKKMDNDVTVLLFEYNAALKSNYKINRRDSFLKINQTDTIHEK
ncbi:MAG: hypothetical protein ACPGU9_05885 [Flavobacteriaceae bacterium]